MTMEFLLLKDKEEMNTHHTNGTFGCPNTRATASQPKEPFFAIAQMTISVILKLSLPIPKLIINQ